MTPNHALKRTAASHHCCNRRVSWLPSLSLGRSAATWSAGKRLRLLSIVPLLIFVVYGVWTEWYFVPINHYIGGEHYDAVILKAKVDGWVFWEIPRAVLVGLGLVVSICLLELYGRRASKSPQSAYQSLAADGAVACFSSIFFAGRMLIARRG